MRRIITLIAILVYTTNVFSEQNLIDYVVAQVGSKIILKSDLEMAIMQLEGQGYSIDDKTKCKTFEDLISQKILMYQAKLDSINVTYDEIKMRVDYTVEDYIRRLGSREQVEAYFKKDIDQIKTNLAKTMKEVLTTQKMRMKLTEEVAISMPEIKQFFSLMSEETLPMVPEKYEFAQITRDVKPSKEDKQKVKDKLNDFRERIMKGDASFSGLASLYSVCPSAKDRGELGFSNRASLDPNFAAVAFRLKKGEVSRVVKSEFGYHIIKLIDRKGDRINVRHILLRPEISAEQIQAQINVLDSISKGINEGKVTFEQAAKYYSSDEDSRANSGIAINSENGGVQFKLTDLNEEEAKVIPNLSINQISEPILSEAPRTKSKQLKLVKMLKIIPAHKLNYKDDYLAVKDQALNRKKEKTIKKWVEEKFKSTYIRIDNNHKKCSFLKERGIL
jgi:peptidyl-prolyl cis-trans isomerase SurA